MCTQNIKLEMISFVKQHLVFSAVISQLKAFEDALPTSCRAEIPNLGVHYLCTDMVAEYPAGPTEQRLNLME